MSAPDTAKHDIFIDPDEQTGCHDFTYMIVDI
jgi:hypothetical protein